MRPNINYSKSSNDKNVTGLIMMETNSFEEAQRTIKAILSVSPEPRIYKYSTHRETESLLRPKITKSNFVWHPTKSNG